MWEHPYSTLRNRTVQQVSEWMSGTVQLKAFLSALALASGGGGVTQVYVEAVFQFFQVLSLVPDVVGGTCISQFGTQLFHC